MRGRIKRLLTSVGLFRPVPAAWGATKVAEAIPFLGDAPRVRGGERAANPLPIRDYSTPPPVSLTLRNVVYTPHGLAIVRGGIEEAATFSPLQPPLLRPGDWIVRERLPEATLVQTDFNISYGDWVGEVLLPLAAAGPGTGPLLIPARFLQSRRYAAAELDALGLRWRPVERAVRIGAARVLPKRRYLVRWTREDVHDFRAAFGIAPPPPRPGSLVYLSRRGVPGSARGARPLPQAELAGLTAQRGGTTLETARLGRSDYLAAAGEVETVIAEHGSAMINLLGWSARNVVEVVHADWWGPGMMTLARASGVRNYAIVVHDGDAAATVARVAGWLESFADPALPPLWSD